MDGNTVWCMDDAIGGLYQINTFTYKVKSILAPSQIYKYGKIKIITIFKWEERIILVPEKLECFWIFYNKVTDNIHYKKIKDIKGTAIGGRIVGNYLFLAPRSIDDQIIIINLQTFCCVKKLNICKATVQDINVNKSWDVVATYMGIVFTFYNTKYIMNVNSEEIRLHVADIPYGICSLSVWENELWVLPSKGRNIYMTDINGKRKNTVCLISDERFTDVSAFARIVATEKYIFLLPFSAKEIYVYLKKEKKTVRIKPEGKRLYNIFPEVSNASSYWEYYIQRNNINFFPLSNPFLVVDLETLKWKEKDIFLPSILSGHDLKFWWYYSRMLNGNDFVEEYRTNAYELFLKYVKNFEADVMNPNHKIGKLIWKQINLSF